MLVFVLTIRLDIDGWGLSPRGAGYLFGGDVVAQVYSSLLSFKNFTNIFVVQPNKWA